MLCSPRIFGEESDLTGVVTEEAFEEVAKARPGYNGSNSGIWQVWASRSTRVGDFILANQGTREVLGIGRVVGAYRHDPTFIAARGSRYPGA